MKRHILIAYMVAVSSLLLSSYAAYPQESESSEEPAPRIEVKSSRINVRDSEIDYDAMNGVYRGIFNGVGRGPARLMENACRHNDFPLAANNLQLFNLSKRNDPNALQEQINALNRYELPPASYPRLDATRRAMLAEIAFWRGDYNHMLRLVTELGWRQEDGNVANTEIYNPAYGFSPAFYGLYLVWVERDIDAAYQFGQAAWGNPFAPTRGIYPAPDAKVANGHALGNWYESHPIMLEAYAMFASALAYAMNDPEALASVNAYLAGQDEYYHTTLIADHGEKRSAFLKSVAAGNVVITPDTPLKTKMTASRFSAAYAYPVLYAALLAKDDAGLERATIEFQKAQSLLEFDCTPGRHSILQVLSGVASLKNFRIRMSKEPDENNDHSFREGAVKFVSAYNSMALALNTLAGLAYPSVRAIFVCPDVSDHDAAVADLARGKQVWDILEINPAMASRPEFINFLNDLSPCL